MCKGNKQCKKCRIAAIGKTTMARKSRKSSAKGTMTTVAALGGGIVLGKVAIPKLVEKVDPNSKIDPRMIDGGVAVAAYFLGRQQKGVVQNIAYGTAAGAVANLVMGIAGLGYTTYDGSTDLHNVAGGYGASRQTGGDV